METSSKVLTVSYGTFSCTMEGFDDPFSTMKMVAEYFRKLSAEDRFFGGEPQTPDASMLHQIAENTNPKKVDAEVSDNGVVLRQKDAEAEPDLDLTAVETVEQPAPSEVVAEVAAPAEEVAVAPSEVVEVVEAVASEEVAEVTDAVADASVDVAEVAAEMADVETSLPSEAPIVFSQDEHEQASKAKGKAKRKARREAKRLARAKAAEEAASVFRSTRHETADVEDVVAEEAEAPIEVAVKEEAPVEAADPFEHMPVVDFKFDEDEYDDIKNAAELAAEADATKTEADKSVEATLAKIRQTVESADVVPVGDLSELDIDFEALVPTDASKEAELNDVLVLEDTARVEDDADEKRSWADEAAAMLENQDQDAEAIQIVNDDAAVVDVQSDIAVIETTLSEDDEADLALELARAREEDERETRLRQRQERAASLRDTDSRAQDEDALDRLLQATNSIMDEPEVERRQESLNSIKAAVAATEAEQALVEEDDKDDVAENKAADLAAYRDDLKRAQKWTHEPVMIKPTTAPMNTGSNKASQASAPLILVSEQRVTEQSEPMEFQQDVASTDGNLALQERPQEQDLDETYGIPAEAYLESTSFRDFAVRTQAVEMHDILEAAAAYTATVEGKPRFSRAQVMAKLAKVADEQTYTKEAGLRSFGRLLREGKILRVQDGKFAISKSSRYALSSRN